MKGKIRETPFSSMLTLFLFVAWTKTLLKLTKTMLILMNQKVTTRSTLILIAFRSDLGSFDDNVIIFSIGEKKFQTDCFL